MTGDQVYAKLIHSCVWIVATDGRKLKLRDGRVVDNLWTGSGSVVDRGGRLVITNEHVANESCVSILVFFPEFRNGTVITERDYYEEQLAKGKGIPARVVKGGVDKKRDLALIQLDHLPDGAVPVRIAARSARPGQALHIIGGTPKGSKGQWIHSDGSVRQVSFATWQYDDGFPRAAMVIDSQVASNPGDSGAPVVDAQCRLVGVHAMGGGGLATVGHIDVSEVRDHLRTHFRQVGKEWKEPADDGADAPGADVERQLKALDGPDAAKRERAVKQLAALGPDARPAVRKLLQMLRDPKQPGHVREAIEGALAEIGPPDRKDVPALVEALQDEASLPARRYAADALGRMGDDARPAVPALVRALRAADARLRRDAAGALGQMGLAVHDQAQPALVPLLKDPDKEVRKAALGALVRMGRVTDAAAMRAMLADRLTPPESRVYAALALIDFGAESLPALIDALSAEPDPWVARVAAVALRAVNSRTRETGDALARAVDHKEKEVRVAAAQALGALGLDTITLPGVLKALGSPDADVRRAALQGLPNLSTFVKDAPSPSLTKEAVGTLKPALASKEPAARLFAAFALGGLGAEAADAARELRAALTREKMTDPKLSPLIRLEILAAFAEIGPVALATQAGDADAFLGELKEIATDTDDATLPHQTCAALALAKLAPEKSQAKAGLPTLVRALRLHNFNKPERDPVEDALHERAKKALVKFGKGAALTLAQTCVASFSAAANEPPQQKLEKAYARKMTFQVLERIGEPAKHPEVYKIIRATVANAGEATDVKEAAQNAYVAIYGKK
jgi:HEAT repeat protein